VSIFRSAVRTVAARCTLPFALHRCKRRHRRGGARRRKYLSRNIAVMAQRRHHQCQTTRAWKVLDCVARGEGFGFWVLVARQEGGPGLRGSRRRLWVLGFGCAARGRSLDGRARRGKVLVLAARREGGSGCGEEVLHATTYQEKKGSTLEQVGRHLRSNVKEKIASMEIYRGEE